MRRITAEEIIARMVGVHGNTYDYTKVAYRGGKFPVEIICPTHGSFWQTTDNHCKGQRCPACANRPRYTQEMFIREAIEKHGSKLDFSKAVYVAMQQYVTVICPTHGEFQTFPERILMGRGCFACGAIVRGKARKKDTSWFVGKAKEIHGDRYDYTNTSFGDYHGVISYNCSVHGPVEQVASKHLAGQGCSKCANSSSAAELQIHDYIVSKGFNVVHRDKSVCGMELDIYVPEKKLAIEYCGLYWHSTHNLRGDATPLEKVHAVMYKHSSKWLGAASAGVRLITIYDDEWINSKEKVLAAIDVALGVRTEKVGARKCAVEKLESAVAREFFDRTHLQGAPAGGTTYGLVNNGEVVAAMCFTKSASSRGAVKSGQLELSRYASTMGVIGGASKLFNAAIVDQNPDEVISYSDNRWFDGGMYSKLGFDMVAKLDPDYNIVLRDKGTRIRKDHFQLSKLGKWCDLYEVSRDTIAGMTELEATFELKCGRIYDCGKKKWLWTNPNKIPLTPAKV